MTEAHGTIETRNSKKQRSDLVWRDTTEDPRFEAIADRVIDYLDTVPPARWTPPMWAAFKDIWKHRLSKKSSPVNPALAKMSSEELKALVTGKSSTSGS